MMSDTPFTSTSGQSSAEDWRLKMNEQSKLPRVLAILTPIYMRFVAARFAKMTVADVKGSRFR